MSKEQIVTHLTDLSKQSIKGKSRSLLASDLDTLTSLLIQQLSHESDPSLLRKIVIYPTNDIKEFIIQQIVKEKGSLFGVRFLSLPQAIEHFIKITSIHPPTFPNHTSLTLHIEQEIRKILSSGMLESLPLLEYLSGDEKKLLHLSEKLGSVFLHYGLYGSYALIEWERKKGWQQLLWERLKTRWDFPCNLLSTPLTPPFPMEVHLFHPTHIPKLYRNYFDRLEEYLSIQIYFLTPTPLYWGDLLGNKTLARLDQSFEKKGVKVKERIAFSSFSNANSLMQNLSSLAQPVFNWLSEKESIEAFTPPVGFNLLSSMKVALYDLSPFEKESLIQDDSLQIHEAPNKLREVEILLENLKILYQKEPFSFEDVLVLAPNIESYHPYIKLLFTNDSLFGSFFDIGQNKPILPLFFDFIESRFEPTLLFKLLDSPVFQKKTPFSEEEIDFFKSLVEEKGIDWGFNLEMRQEILGENNLSSRGSWTFAFDTIIHSLPFSSSNIEISKFELLGQWISFIQKLHLDLSTLKKGSHSIFEWIEITSSLLDTYFQKCEETDSLKKELRKLFEVGSFVQEEFFYPSIKIAIDSYFQERKETLSSSIRFSSITDPAIPSVSILCVLGLDEESFPRKPSHSSINELRKANGSDHQPEIGEKDRYFFIQTILSAKKHLIFSFVNQSVLDGKELYPSPLLKELPTTITSHPAIPCFYKKEDTLPKLFSSTIKEPTEISYKSLIKLMKHPLQFYANEVAGIYFESREEETKKKNSEFFLSYQDRALLSSKLLKKEEKEILTEADHNNLLPTALFKEVAETEIQERLKEMKEYYQTLGIKKGEIFSLLLHPSIEKLSFLNEEFATAPTINIPLSPNQSIILYGKIEFLTPQGALINGEDSFEELWKALPTLYLLAHLFKEIPPTLLFAKSGTKKIFAIEDPLRSLTSLIKYYLAAHKRPSPFMPNRIDSFLSGDIEKFLLLSQKKETFFQDPYILKIEPDLSFPWKDVLPIIPIPISE